MGLGRRTGSACRDDPGGDAARPEACAAGGGWRPAGLLPAAALAWLADVGAEGGDRRCGPGVSAAGAVDGRLPSAVPGGSHHRARGIHLARGEGDRCPVAVPGCLDEVRAWVPDGCRRRSISTLRPMTHSRPAMRSLAGGSGVARTWCNCRWQAGTRCAAATDHQRSHHVAHRGDRAIALAIYAAMLTLAIAALAFHAAARPRVPVVRPLRMHWFAVAAAMNGHLVASVPRSSCRGARGVLGHHARLRWGGRAHGADTRSRASRKARRMAVAALAYVAAAVGSCWSRTPGPPGSAGSDANLGWIAAVSASFVLVIWRGGAASRWRSQCCCWDWSASAGGAHELMQSGRLPDNAWTRWVPVRPRAVLRGPLRRLVQSGGCGAAAAGRRGAGASGQRAEAAP